MALAEALASKLEKAVFPSIGNVIPEVAIAFVWEFKKRILLGVYINSIYISNFFVTVENHNQIVCNFSKLNGY